MLVVAAGLRFSTVLLVRAFALLIGFGVRVAATSATNGALAAARQHSDLDKLLGFKLALGIRTTWLSAVGARAMLRS